ncbi:hypothetical protein E2C01_048639 [Portunus trituberculatus]|uniref:Uncharacterized protein n=1 Tax=Portunus trituberculatus TaxID=210409 RepID=A0A5B7GBL1_PORTR|nr:hypothetical protein [Portunus trituberculatus]
MIPPNEWQGQVLCVLNKNNERSREDDNPLTHTNHRRQTTLPDKLWQRTA